MNTNVTTKFAFGRQGKKLKDFSHPSVIALIKEAGGQFDPEEIVRKKCREIVKNAKAYGWSGFPFCPFKLASLVGIKVKPVKTDIGAEARIFGTTKQVIIEYRPDFAPMERLRFSICHEIVHTIFPDCYEMVRHSQGKGDILTEADREFERLCDIGAGELLMPQEEFSSDLEKTSFALTDVCTLKKKYFASAEATVNRCLGITELPRAAVFFHHLQERLAVKIFWKSNSFRPFIQPGFVPPGCSVVHNLAFSDSTEPTPTAVQKETWLPDGRPIELHVQAMTLPLVPQHPQYPKAMALVMPCRH